MRSAEVAVADGKPPARLSRGIHERAGRLDTTQIYTTIRPQQRRRVLRGEGGADAERVRTEPFHVGARPADLWSANDTASEPRGPKADQSAECNLICGGRLSRRNSPR